jgi:hypothetical protein
MLLSLTSQFPAYVALRFQTVTDASDDRAWLRWLLLGAIVAVLVLYVRASYRASLPFRIEGSTTLPEAAARDRITDEYVRAGWAASPLSDGRVLFSRTTQPKLGTTLMLAVFFILPALLYVVSSQRRQTAELHVAETSRLHTRIEILGNTTGYGGVDAAAGILRTLPKP